MLCIPAKTSVSGEPCIFRTFSLAMLDINEILSGWAFVEDFYIVIHGVHATSKGHIGTKKTTAEVGKLFECVPRSAIDKYM